MADTSDTADMPDTRARGRERAAPSAGRRVAAGALAGLVGGALMAAWSMGHAAAQQLDWLLPLELIAASLLGVEALLGGGGVLLLGAALHFATAAAWGALFGWLLSARAPSPGTFVAAVLYGMVVLLVMTFAVLPWLDPTMFHRVQLTELSWFLGHLLYGLALALTPGFASRLAREGGPRRAPAPSPA